MTKFGFISATLLTIGFFAGVCNPQETAKTDKVSGRTVTVFVDNDRVKVTKVVSRMEKKASKCQSVQIA